MLRADYEKFLSHSFLPCFNRYLISMGRLRSMGSAALNMASVASGGTDSYFEFGIKLKY